MQESQNTWTVEIGRDRGSYRTIHRGGRFSQASRLFDCYHVHSGGKKRLRLNGRTVHRVLTTETTEVIFKDERLF